MFSPKPADAALRLVLRVIDASQQTLVIAAYTLTSNPVSDALVRAAARGVKVWVRLDANHAENVVVVWRNPAFARRFAAEFTRLWEEGKGSSIN